MKKLLVITGGSRGIGLACARRFANEGYEVVNLSRHQPELAGIHHIAVDLTDINWPAQHAAELEQYVQGADSISIIHNAAMMAKDSISDVEASSLAQVLQINVIAASQLNQLLLAKMAPGSSILYVSSTLGEKAVGNTCSYVTSKHAQIGLMRSTCQDLMGKGIHTAAVCPGFTDTEMLRQHVGGDETILEHFAAQTSFNRLLDPSEIADTLWFCASSPAINGAVLHANLGQLEH